mmetsp:Transcript_20329/g.32823  ORF Transcript_20329/g.32823 Transcript_20329/m.32823 type:complete len:516 (-) Transcript_20329:133-1680(-)
MLEYSDVFGFLKDVDMTPLMSVTAIVLSVLLALRTTRAYDRFWEGITLVQLMRAEWFTAVSTLIAFSNVALKQNPKNEEIAEDVRNFQFTLIRLMSLMHGSALRQIGGYEEEFEVVDITALDESSLSYLASCGSTQVNPVEVLLHWVQVLIVDALTSNKALSVPAPILTRAFQTLTRGMVNCTNCRKLADCPFPFPLYQMVLVLLIIQCIITPCFVAAYIENAILAALCTFVPLFGMWSITFTAGELEQPFGSDPNDLPLKTIQKQYNSSLMMLLDKATFRAPTLVEDARKTVKQLRRVHTANADDWSRTDTVLSYENRYQPSEDDTTDRSAPTSRQVSPSPGYRRSVGPTIHEESCSTRESFALGYELKQDVCLRIACEDQLLASFVSTACIGNQDIGGCSDSDYTREPCKDDADARHGCAPVMSRRLSARHPDHSTVSLGEIGVFPQKNPSHGFQGSSEPQHYIDHTLIGTEFRGAVNAVSSAIALLNGQEKSDSGAGVVKEYLPREDGLTGL